MPKIHDSITFERVMEAYERQMFSLDNPGFCLSCGVDHDEWEPDAEIYECYNCGENKVMDAQNVLMLITKKETKMQQRDRQQLKALIDVYGRASLAYGMTAPNTSALDIAKSERDEAYSDLMQFITTL